jgi:hypothetical protein
MEEVNETSSISHWGQFMLFIVMQVTHAAGLTKGQLVTDVLSSSASPLTAQ